MRDWQTKQNLPAGPDSLSVNKLGAGEINSARTELKNAALHAGLTLAPSDGTGEDATQLAQAMFINGVGASRFVAGGTADAITLTPATGDAGLRLPPDLTTMNGATLSFKAVATNTGPVTVSIGQATASLFDPVPLLSRDGAALVGGDVIEGLDYSIRYDAVAEAFVLALANVPYLDVSSISMLRANVIEIEDIAYVRGYTEPSDMGGGVFYKDSSDTTSTDDGGCIIVDAVNQRWKRSSKHDIRPEWFGAKGDGVTDDTAAFQAALDALSPPTIPAGAGDSAITGGGVISLSDRVYKIADTLSIGPYVKVLGSGLSAWQQAHGGPSAAASKGSVILWVGSSTHGALHAVPYNVSTGLRFSDPDYTIQLTDGDVGTYTLCHGVAVEGVNVFAPSGAKFGLRLSLCPTARVDGLSTYNCDYSLIGEANWEGGIKNCVFTSFDVGYLGSSGQHAIHLDNCWFHGGSGNTSAIGVRLDFSAGVVITAPSLEDLATGVFCTNSEGLTVLGGQCERVDNLLKCNNSHGVRWLGGDLYNPVAGGAWNGSYVFDGFTCEAVIDGLQIDHPNYPTGEQLFPGKWLGPNVSGNSVRLRVAGGLPRAGDGVPNPSAGAVVFTDGVASRTYLGAGESGSQDQLYANGSFVGGISRDIDGEVHFTDGSGLQIVTILEDGSAQIGLNQHLVRWVYFYDAGAGSPSIPGLGPSNSGSFAFNNANGDMWIFGPAGWKKAITYSSL